MKKSLTTLAFFALALSSSAAVIYHNSATLNEGPQFGSIEWAALSFRTTASDYVLDQVTIPVFNFQSLQSGQVVFDLYDASGVGSSPGILVTTLKSFNIGAVSNQNYEDLTADNLNWNLTPNSYYYVIIRGFELGEKTFMLGVDEDAVGDSLGISESINFGLNWSPPSDNQFYMGVISASAIPEPTSVASVCALLASSLFIRRRI